MTTYLEQINEKIDAQISSKIAEREIANQQAMADWYERLTPLEDRLAKLLAAIPSEIKNQGVSLPAIRNLLAGKWRGKCHPGELGIALRKLGYVRRRNWSKDSQSFCALWFLE
jgi:hypothetical protein